MYFCAALLTLYILFFLLGLWIYKILSGAVFAVIIWQLDFQLLVQSVPITTKVESLNAIHSEV
jgi:hypothetical protein